MKNMMRKMMLMSLLALAQNQVFAAAGRDVMTIVNMCCTGNCTGTTNCTTVNAVGDTRVFTDSDLFNVTFSYDFVNTPRDIKLDLPTVTKKSGISVTFEGLDSAHKNIKILTTYELVDGIYVYKFYRKFINQKSTNYQEVGQLTAYESLPYIEFTAYPDGRIEWYNRQTNKMAAMNIGKEDLSAQVMQPKAKL